MPSKRFGVIGLGRFGYTVATTLANSGAEVIAIDSDSNVINEVSDIVSVAVCMNSVDKEGLVAHGMDKCDAAVVAIGQNFEANVLTTSILKDLGVKKVVARASTDVQKSILERIGADQVIFPEDAIGVRVAQSLLSSRIVDITSLFEGLSIAQVVVPKELVGKKIGEMKFRQKYKCNIVVIKRKTDQSDISSEPERYNVLPEPEDQIQMGDILVVVGTEKDIEKLASSL
ncbi:MAG: TrkA family potassium uptake protein [bacterium]|jgi:trk system potassium uptake protein TrkA